MNAPCPVLADLLLLAIVALMAGHTWSLHRRRRLLLLDPLFAFWAGIFVIYVNQPLYCHDILISWHGENVFDASLAWTLLGLVCVIAGYESAFGARLGLRIPEVPRELVGNRLAAAGVLFVLLGVAGYLYLFDSAGGVVAWLAVPRGGTDYDNVSGYLAEMSNLLPLGVVLLLFEAHFGKPVRFKQAVLWILAALLWFWFLYLGSRSRLIGFTVAALGASCLPRQKSPHPLVAGAVFFALFALSNFQEHYRDKFSDLSLHLDQIDASEAWGNSLPPLLGGDEELQQETVAPGIEFNCVMTVIDLVPDKVPYNFGYGYLEIFTRWVPRSMWPDKIYPQMESVQGVLREGMLSGASVRDTDLLMGPAFTFVGHWFYVGGPVGLIFGGLITGVLFRLIRFLYDRDPTSQGGVLIYASLLGIGFTEAAATPFGWLSTLPFLIGPLVVILFICRAPKPVVKLPLRSAGGQLPIRPRLGAT